MGLLSEEFLRLRFGGLFSGGLIFFFFGGGGGGAYYRNFTVYIHLARILYKCSVQMNFTNSTEGRGDRRTVILSVGL